jgi:hypothetical protein
MCVLSDFRMQSQGHIHEVDPVGRVAESKHLETGKLRPELGSIVQRCHVMHFDHGRNARDPAGAGIAIEPIACLKIDVQKRLFMKPADSLQRQRIDSHIIHAVAVSGHIHLNKALIE